MHKYKSGFVGEEEKLVKVAVHEIALMLSFLWQ